MFIGEKQSCSWEEIKVSPLLPQKCVLMSSKKYIN